MKLVAYSDIRWNKETQRPVRGLRLATWLDTTEKGAGRHDLGETILPEGVNLAGDVPSFLQASLARIPFVALGATIGYIELKETA